MHNVTSFYHLRNACENGDVILFERYRMKTSIDTVFVKWSFDENAPSTREKFIFQQNVFASTVKSGRNIMLIAVIGFARMSNNN